ncbi:MAG TPA: hypothetical protein VI233_17805 [Puia sp.]
MEYRIGSGEKALYLLIAAACAAGGIFLLVNTLGNWAPLRSADGFKLLGIAALSGAALLLYREVMRLRVTVDESAESLEIVNFNSSKSYLLKEIDGYRRGAKGVFKIYLKNDGRGVDIPQGLGRREDLLEWFDQHYRDLDAVELEAETKVLLQNEEFGFTEEDRAGRLASARRWGTIGTAAGAVLFFWSLIYPKPFEIVMIILFLAPWVGAFATWKFKGLLKLYKLKNSPYPSLVFLMTLPPLGAMVRTLLEYELYGFSRRAALLAGGGVLLGGLVFTGVCWKAIVHEGKKALIGLGIFVIAGLYSWSLLTFSNCYYDKSEPDVWNVTVLGKRVSHGKSTSYYLSLSSWGKYGEGKEAQVTKALFNRVSEQQVIHVYLYKGRWELPWYAISD